MMIWTIFFAVIAVVFGGLFLMVESGLREIEHQNEALRSELAATRDALSKARQGLADQRVVVTLDGGPLASTIRRLRRPGGGVA